MAHRAQFFVLFVAFFTTAGGAVYLLRQPDRPTPVGEEEARSPDGPLQRVIALSLAAEEIIVELAGPECLAAVSPLAKNPTYSNVLDRIPADAAVVDGTALERIVSLRPQLVFVANYTDPRTRENLTRFNVRTMQLAELRDFGAIRRNILQIGGVLGRSAAARKLVSEFDRRLAAVDSSVQAQLERGRPRPRVLFVGNDPLQPWTVGANTVVSAMIVRAGGINVAVEQGVKHELTLNREAAVRWQPDVLLIDQVPDRRDEQLANLRHDPVLSRLQAVRNGRLTLVRPGLLTSVNHHAAAAVEALHHQFFRVAAEAKAIAEPGQ